MCLGSPVAIAICQENDVRRARDDDAAARGHESINGRQIRRPHIRRIHATVSIRIAQQLHYAIRSGLRRLLELLVRLHTAHLRVELSRLVEFLDIELSRQIVAVQLRDKHSPALIPAYRGGRRDQRLTGDHLHPKTIRQLERRRAFLRRHRLRRVRRLRNLRGQRIAN